MTEPTGMNLALLLMTAAFMENEMKPAWLPMHDPYGLAERPDSEQDIWIMRDEWEEPHLTWWNNIHPQMNIFGLYWTPAIDGEGPPDWERQQ